MRYIWNGNAYSVAGSYKDAVASTTGGCDTAAVLNLTINALLTDTTNATVCTSQLPYIWNGNPYSVAGSYKDTVASTTGGCDTAAALNLTIKALPIATTKATVFTSQLPYIWNGNPFFLIIRHKPRSTLFPYTSLFRSVLNLTINALLTDTTNATVCTSQLPYIWNGNPYSVAGSYKDTVASTTGGCDTA